MIGAVAERSKDFELNPTAEGAWVLRDLVAWCAGGGYGSTIALDAWGINHGTLTNMAIPATTTSGWGWTPLGRPAWNCDGTNDYLYTSDLSNLPGAIPTTAVCTLSVWFRCGQSTAKQDLLSVSCSGSPYYSYQLQFLGATANDPIGAYVQGSGAEATAISAAGINADTTGWHHACGLYSSNVLREIYLDGANYDIDKTNAGTSSPKTPNRLAVGYAVSCNPVGVYFTGQLADPMVHARVLTLPEIQLLADPAWSVLMGGLIIPSANRYVRGWKPGGAPPVSNRRRRFLAACGG